MRIKLYGNIKYGIFFGLLSGSILLASCTKNFREINTDKSGITDGQMQIDYNHLRIPLDIIQQGIYFNYDFGKGKNWPYQLMQNLNADMFSGYMHDAKPLNGGTHNSDYNLQEGWNGVCWEYIYAYIFPQIKKSEDSTRVRYPHLFALTKILKVETMHRVSDIYGPLIYTSFGREDGIYTADTQQETYHAFFRDLDTAASILTDYVPDLRNSHSPVPEEIPSIAGMDILLDGKAVSWLRFANSLRLRLAMRIAMADPAKAKSEFLKAMHSPAGVMEEPADIVKVSTRTGYLNPLGEINRVWNEVYMNANMESILTGYEDPRGAYFFEPCVSDAQMKDPDGNTVTIPLKGTYKGIRQGTCFAHLLYFSFSKIYVNTTTEPVLMNAAEVWFLRAEAALRGWTPEDPGYCYKKGISVSFIQWGISSSADQYMQSDNIAEDYEDPFDPGNNIPARCRVSPRWEEGASAEVKLEKIITQKWLAVFPEGCEAWAEQRRTGYPRLFPVRYNNSPGHCIDTEIMIRRLNFPAGIADTDPETYSALVKALGAPDNAGSRLWWDTGRNF